MITIIRNKRAMGIRILGTIIIALTILLGIKIMDYFIWPKAVAVMSMGFGISYMFFRFAEGIAKGH